MTSLKKFRASARRVRVGSCLAALLAALLLWPAVPAASADDGKAAPPAEPGMPEPGKDDAPAKPDDAPAKPDDAPAPAETAPMRGGIPNPFWDPKKPVPLKEAHLEIDRLKDLRKPKSDNQDIVAALDAAARAYVNLAPNDEAGKATFEADAERFYKEAERAFLDFLKLKKVRPNTSANERDDVNILAAQILGWCRPEVSRALVDAMDKVVLEPKDYDPPPTLFDETFKALALLNTKEGFEYCRKWAKYSTKKGDAERTKAAFDALALFTDVKGSVRHDLVKMTLRTFIGTESAADRGATKEEQTQKGVWDKIKGAVIRTMQLYTKQPKANDGKLIGKLKDFDQWFRDNDSLRNPVWSDPEIVKTK